MRVSTATRQRQRPFSSARFQRRRARCLLTGSNLDFIFFINCIICGLLFYPSFVTALYGGPLFGQRLRNDIGGVSFGCNLRAAIYGGARCLTGGNFVYTIYPASFST